MLVQVRGRDIDVSEAIHRQIEARLVRHLRRQQRRVEQVRVWLKDLNGPRGGIDKMCHVDVDLVPHGRIIIQEQDDDLYRAIGRAGKRLKQVLRRRLNRHDHR